MASSSGEVPADAGEHHDDEHINIMEDDDEHVLGKVIDKAMTPEGEEGTASDFECWQN